MGELKHREAWEGSKSLGRLAGCNRREATAVATGLGRNSERRDRQGVDRVEEGTGLERVRERVDRIC